jgi:hypothetical protein
MPPTPVLFSRAPPRYSYVTVTLSPRVSRCEWCGEEFTLPAGPGRPPKYCRRSHRQRHYEARRLGSRRGLTEDEVILGRADYERLRDEIYRLEAACQDAATDRAGSPTKADLLTVIDDLTAVGDAVVRAVVEPLATGG